ICLCYNHERFLREALDSVLAQTYPHLEVIVVDDCSTDNSVSIIQEYLQQYPRLKFISTGHNRGNCAAFNIGWRSSKGEYVIDFATDDVLLPERVAQQITAFQQLDPSFGVVYTDAAYIDDSSVHIGYHNKRKPDGSLRSFAPSGDVFEALLSKYFICPPTMMMCRKVLEDLNGYDESLAYEDFDFWVRSSRGYKYFYLDRVTTQRRVHASSLSQGWYKAGNKLLASTVKVCEKAVHLVQSQEERMALTKRLQYEARHAYLTGNFREADRFFTLLQEVSGRTALYQFLRLLNTCKIDLGFLRRWYYRIRHNS
ncbi:MAG: glycosyltransferase, partial [Hymenobacteraceae bacterium]|nr:glycosyltransferase [Hymenobacteraceae bacterium]